MNTAQVALREQVAEEVRALMARRRISGVKLAEKLGRSQPYIWRRLNGETAFDVDDLQALAGILNVGVLELFGASASPSNPLRAEGDNRIYLRHCNVHATLSTCGYSRCACTHWTQSQLLRFSFGHPKIAVSSCCKSGRRLPRPASRHVTVTETRA